MCLMLQLIWSHYWTWTWELLSRGHWNLGAPELAGRHMRLSLQALPLGAFLSSEALLQCGGATPLSQTALLNLNSRVLEQIWVRCEPIRSQFHWLIQVNKDAASLCIVSHLFPSIAYVAAHSPCLWIADHHNRRNNWEAKGHGENHLLLGYRQSTPASPPLHSKSYSTKDRS